MGPRPKPRRHPYDPKLARKGQAGASLKREAKQRKIAKIKAEMGPRAKPPKQKGTHWHEPSGPSRLTAEAQWVKDNGWSGKQ